MDTNERIFVAGHRGMVGSAIVRNLRKKGFEHIITRSHTELDLTDQQAVRQLFRDEKIDRIVLAAAKVGGIHANSSYPAEFIYSNLMIQNNIIEEGYRAGVEHLLFLGSSCIYPKFAPQPIKEEYLLTGELEPTNEPYALAKIAGIKMCESYNRQYGTSYRAVMPTNLYGQGDNYHLENSHVIPAMLRKYHLAKLAQDGDLQGILKDEERYGLIPDDICAAMGYNRQKKILDATIKPKVILWGTGAPMREFLHVDDMAAACVFVMGMSQDHFTGNNPSFLNVGYGSDMTIKEIAAIIADLVGFTGETVFDSTKPDGTPRKLIDSSLLISFGWKPTLIVQDGLEITYRDYSLK